MRHYSMIFSLTVVLAACQRYEDTGRACVMPEQIECNIDPAAESDTGIEYDWCHEVDLTYCQCQGYYPADKAYEVHAVLSDGGGGYAVKDKCRVKMDGERTLTVKASYWQEPERDAIVEPGAEAFCSTPVLTAGEWTLRYGDGEVVFLVGDDQIQDMACAYGD